jgi:predicted DNA binding CopG/RHH family protein
MKYKDQNRKEIVLDKEEAKTLQEIESGDYKSVSNVKKEITEYTAIMREHKKDRSLTLRISESDLNSIKARAQDAGMPYQTLIGALLHQFAHKKIDLKM